MLRTARQPGVARSFGKRIKRIATWTLLAAGLGFGAAFWYREFIFSWILAPADGLLSPFEGGLPIFTAPTQMLGTAIQLGVYGALTAALPVLTVGLYRLASPSFSPSQRWTIKIFSLSAVLLFATGIAFVYYVMLPVGLKFLLNFGEGIAIPLISVTQYLELLIQLMFWMGVIFEMPLAMFLLTRLRLIKYQRFRSVRKFVPFAALILGIIITPGTDPLNMLLVAIPIVVLYEFGLFLAWIAHPEEGDYLFLKTTRSAVTGVTRRVRAIVGWPVMVIRRVYRTVRRLR